MLNKYRFQWIFLFLVGFLFTVLLSVINVRSIAKANTWQAANQYFEPSVLEHIIAENTTFPPIELEKYVKVNELLNSPRLVFINFNSDVFCGQLGCAYSLYQEAEQGFVPLLQRYLNPNLPLGTKLVEVSDIPAWQSVFPCLIFNQFREAVLEKTKLCYNGESYFSTETKIEKVKID